LRQPGAPLDNNICERALKKAILHRKNSLFYKTENGARVGDLFMSLVHTCELCGANPFDYLTQLQQHMPSSWRGIPPDGCNYRETLPRAGISVDSGRCASRSAVGIARSGNHGPAVALACFVRIRTE
jgi:hypothetical protein